MLNTISKTMVRTVRLAAQPQSKLYASLFANRQTSFATHKQLEELSHKLINESHKLHPGALIKGLHLIKFNP